MPLLLLRDVAFGFGHPPLVEHASAVIERGERIGLLGRNGSGKTTLLGLLAGLVEPEAGEVVAEADLRVAYLPQDVPREETGTIRAVVERGADADQTPDSAWRAERRVDEILVRMALDPTARFESLSAGMRRRVLLAQALAKSPELLLLDEPTNHLDLEAILWLETFLRSWEGTVVFVTHDRAFLRRMATRIIEIDRGRLFDWACSYETFLVRKEEAIAALDRQEELFDKKLAQEEAWIRQGIKARRTRNEGRVRALEALRRERRERRAPSGSMNLEIQTAEPSGRQVIKAVGLTFGYPGRPPIVSGFSTTIYAGDKIGIVGPNGAGKTTLLRLLLGRQTPERGEVKLGANLEIAYFDQLRDQLDLDASVQDNVAHGSDGVRIGDRNRHVISYLEDFLFSRERSRMPVRLLSGGERMRVMLARLFARPANVIVLDEPTNDLDTESLEMLEDLLVGFSGTVLVVSHDREFLDNVVSSTIAFEPDGVREYVGGYSDWQRQSSARAAAAAPALAAQTKPAAPSARPAAPPGRRKRSYREEQELKGLPAAIEDLEAAVGRLHAAMAAPAFFKRPSEAIAADQSELKALEAKLAVALARWEELEALGG